MRLGLHRHCANQGDRSRQPCGHHPTQNLNDWSRDGYHPIASPCSHQNPNGLNRRRSSWRRRTWAWSHPNGLNHRRSSWRRWGPTGSHLSALTRLNSAGHCWRHSHASRQRDAPLTAGNSSIHQMRRYLRDRPKGHRIVGGGDGLQAWQTMLRHTFQNRASRRNGGHGSQWCTESA